jgi:hypothetical protein
MNKYIRVGFVSLFIVSCNVAAENYIQIYEPVDHRGIPLTKPNNKDICIEYRKYLNSFPSEKYPLICDRPVSSKFTQFSKVAWNKMNVKENVELIKRLDVLLWYKGNNLNEEKWMRNLKIRLANNKVNLYSGEILIGKAKIKIYRYEYAGECNSEEEKWKKYPGGVRYFTEDANGDISLISPFGGRDMLFKYKESIYFDSHYKINNDGTSELRLFESYFLGSKLSFSHVCTYKYTSQ